MKTGSSPAILAGTMVTRRTTIGLRKRPLYTSTHFEIDRSTVTRQIRNLRHAVGEGATEMEMVAAERIFAKALSRAITLRARKLHLISRDLDNLLRVIARAHLPKTAKTTRT